MTVEAKVVADSISPAGIRLTTMQLRYPKFIHSEFMTHRVFSRNASSSRAIPTTRLLEEVRGQHTMAKPVAWGRNKSGMQAGEDHAQVVEVFHDHFGRPLLHPDRCNAEVAWERAALFAAQYAEALWNAGYHKQIVNRLLEPFSHINVVVTATEWDNFFGLRLHKDAQPEMRALAVAMWEVRRASVPKECAIGGWHLPFVDDETYHHIKHDRWLGVSITDKGHAIPAGPLDDIAIKVSVARCARVSYLSFDTGKRSTVEEDLKLYDRLMGAQPLHASPAEHQATPDEPHEWGVIDRYNNLVWDHPEQWGNFKGWRQYRKMLPGEAVAPLPEEYCPGHVASERDPKVCGRCGTHVDSLRLPEEDER